MLALGDALALVVSEARGFEVDDFAELHPGGSLGRKLSSVDEAMRPLSECRVARSLQSVREMLGVVARPGRRTGAVMLVDDAGVLEGIFTDSDLAKMLEHRRDQELDQPIRNVMTKSFSAIQSGARLSDAIDVMVMRKISELPVVDHRDQPIGLIDITDVLQIEHECQTPSNTSLRNASNDSTHSFGMKLKNSSLGNGPTMDDEWSEAPRTLRFFGPKS
jgi:arabinose-5-phosphate isomerase